MTNDLLLRATFVNQKLNTLDSNSTQERSKALDLFAFVHKIHLFTKYEQPANVNNLVSPLPRHPPRKQHHQQQPQHRHQPEEEGPALEGFFLCKAA